jgi:galactonate dehydratase
MGTFYRGGPVLMSAIGAIDIALWDIAGKYYNTPVYRLLGGPTRNKIRVYVHIGDLPPEKLVENAVKAVKKGYTALRWAPFVKDYQRMRFPEVIKMAVNQVSAVRDAIGDGVDICIDIHTRLTPSETIVLAKELEKYRIFFYEDPTWPENISVMANVARSIKIPIATGEHLYTIHQFAELIEQKAVHMVRPDLCMAGGISSGKKIAALAEAHYVTVVPHNPLSPVSTAASVQLSASIPNFSILEYQPQKEDEFIMDHRPSLMPTDIVDRVLELVKGYLKIPDRPGIGVELQEKVLRKTPYQPEELFLPIREDGSIAAW